MIIANSPINSEVITRYDSTIGTIYIFENFLAAEYKEGIHLQFKSYSEVLDAINKHFGTRPFAFISNRINPYSWDLTEAPKLHDAVPNLKAYAIVYYSEFTRKNVELEKRFYSINSETFSDLPSAVKWVKLEMARKTKSSI